MRLLGRLHRYRRLRRCRLFPMYKRSLLRRGLNNACRHRLPGDNPPAARRWSHLQYQHLVNQDQQRGPPAPFDLRGKLGN
jgi:hypothetical protein